MNSNRVDRIKKRRELKKFVEDKNVELRLVSDKEMIDSFLHSEIDQEKVSKIQQGVEEKYSIDRDVNVTTEEVSNLLADIKREFDETKFQELINASKKTVLNTLIQPFGLAKVLFEDKDGGNVTTIHNAKQGIYANEDERYSKEIRQKDYDYANAREEFKDKKRRSDGTFTDEYSGKTLNEDQVNVDHIIPLKKYHENGGFMQSQEERQAFARDERNYAITEQGLNKSKSDNDLKEFESTQSNGRDANNKEHFDMDNRRVNPAYHRANDAEKDHLPSTKEKAKYYTKSTVKSGLKEAKNMGMQQALGLLLHELVSSIFDEIKDIYQNGFKGDKLDSTFFEVVKERFTRISQNILAKWKDVATAFADGAISGFISNFITTLINMFLTTAKRIVRIIREGIFSILKAIKMLISPPKGMTLKEAAHEATKLIAIGITTSLGILLEEIVENMIGKWVKAIPTLSFISDALSAIIVGLVTGLASILIVYLIDKIDYFGVNSDSKHEFVLDRLENMISSSIQEAETSFEVFELPTLVPFEG